MAWLNKVFGKRKRDHVSPISQETEHAVIVQFNYGFQDLNPLYRLREKLEKAIEKSNLGDYDGHEIATDYSDGFLYMYGPNAEFLYKGVKAILEQTDFMEGATAKLRFGPPEDGVKEITVTIEMES